MTATLLDILMILSLGLLGGTGAGLLIGFIAGKQMHGWVRMQKNGKLFTVLLIAACSAILIAVLAWYMFWYPGK
jgi:F0F1-type ATP synthase membrane subunit c/vacuolar-type H+-ATPase subunit K